MLILQKDLFEAKTPNEKDRLERRIKVTNKFINSLVYELYELTSEEIEVIENQK